MKGLFLALIAASFIASASTRAESTVGTGGSQIIELTFLGNEFGLKLRARHYRSLEDQRVSRYWSLMGGVKLGDLENCPPRATIFQPKEAPFRICHQDSSPNILISEEKWDALTDRDRIYWMIWATLVHEGRFGFVSNRRDQYASDYAELDRLLSEYYPDEFRMPKGAQRPKVRCEDLNADDERDDFLKSIIAKAEEFRKFELRILDNGVKARLGYGVDPFDTMIAWAKKGKLKVLTQRGPVFVEGDNEPKIAKNYRNGDTPTVELDICAWHDLSPRVKGAFAIHEMLPLVGADDRNFYHTLNLINRAAEQQDFIDRWNRPAYRKASP